MWRTCTCRATGGVSCIGMLLAIPAGASAADGPLVTCARGGVADRPGAIVTGGVCGRVPCIAASIMRSPSSLGSDAIDEKRLACAGLRLRITRLLSVVTSPVIGVLGRCTQHRLSYRSSRGLPGSL